MTSDRHRRGNAERSAFPENPESFGVSHKNPKRFGFLPSGPLGRYLDRVLAGLILLPIGLLVLWILEALGWLKK